MSPIATNDAIPIPRAININSFTSVSFKPENYLITATKSNFPNVKGTPSLK